MLAVYGGSVTSVFAAGEFTLAGGKSAPSVARFSSGLWTALAPGGATLGGVAAPITAMSFISAPPVGAAAGDAHPVRASGPCLLAVGKFDTLGNASAPNAAVLCDPEAESAFDWRPLDADAEESEIFAAYTLSLP